MNTKQIIKKLSQKDGLFISFFLPIRPGETRKEFITTFRSRLRDLKHAVKNLRHNEEKYLGAIIKKIEDYLNIVDTHKTKSLAVFASKDFFEVLKLPVSLPLRTHVGTKPLLSPLSKAAEENPPFLLILIDRDSAKLIQVNNSEAEAESKFIKSEVPQRILAKGNDTGQEDKILRHIEDHLHRHLKKILDETKKFENMFPDSLIIIGAQKELVGKFKKLLPASLKTKVIGSFGANTDDNETSLINKAGKIVDDYLEKKAWHKV